MYVILQTVSFVSYKYQRWGCLNMKLPSYQYRNVYYEYKTILRPSYRYNGNRYTQKKTGPRLLSEPMMYHFTDS